MHRLSHKNQTQRYYHGFGSTGNNFESDFFVIIYLSETRGLVKKIRKKINESSR